MLIEVIYPALSRCSLFLDMGGEPTPKKIINNTPCYKKQGKNQKITFQNYFSSFVVVVFCFQLTTFPIQKLNFILKKKYKIKI